MSQEVINLVLREREDKVVLQFNFSPNCPDQIVNLDEESGQGELKSAFISLLKLIIEQDLKLHLIVEDNFQKRLYIEVIEEYVKDLNSELIDVKQKLLKNIKK